MGGGGHHVTAGAARCQIRVKAALGFGTGLASNGTGSARLCVMVRFRQFVEHVQHRLLYLPMVLVVLSIGLAQVMLAIDQQLDANALPEVLETTVDGGRAILSSISAGLISSVTLLLSLMLVAVQLASSQFSPRTLRDWIGDRTLQWTIGVVLGTTVYCLLVLRQTRNFGEGQAFTPHLSVILAVVLGIASLVAVVRSVDHLTDSLRVGRVASRIRDDTVGMITRSGKVDAKENPSMAPAWQPTAAEQAVVVPDDAVAIEAPGSGWVQYIDGGMILRAAPEGSTAYVSVAVGSFTLPDAPLVWLWPRPEPDNGCFDKIRSAIALGDTRTMQQDIGYGILQLVDIALRALSPGINDPNTANEIIVHLGVVMLSLWERETAAMAREEAGVKLVSYDLQHGDYLHAGFDQLRRHGADAPEVAAMIVRTLAGLHSETIRRDLPGPLEPLEEIIDDTLRAVNATSLSDHDKQTVSDLCPAHLRPASTS